MMNAWFLVLFGWSGNSSGATVLPFEFPTLEACSEAAQNGRGVGSTHNKLPDATWSYCVPVPKGGAR